MISFINHENESILRWFYRFCEPRNFSLCPRNLVGVYSGGLGVWFMTLLLSCGIRLLMFQPCLIESWFVWFGPWYSTHPPSFGEVFSRRHRRALEKQGRRSRQNTANNKTTPPWQLLYWCRALGYSILEIIVLILRSNFATRFVCFF